MATLAVKTAAFALALAVLATPAQASPDRGAAQPPTRMFVERPLQALGRSFLAQSTAPRPRPVLRAASVLPEPDNYSLLFSGIGLLLFVAYRRRRAAA